jgi:hypothetical protein
MFLRQRLPRWTLAPHPQPPGLFHHLGRAASDNELGEPLWPVLVAALTMEDLGCATSAAIALASRYGATGGTQARDGVLRALRPVPDGPAGRPRPRPASRRCRRAPAALPR